MPHNKSCIKRLKQASKANERNRFFKATLRSEIKKIRVMDVKADAQEQLKVVYSTLDKLVKKGLIHKNKSANQKSKLSKFVKSL
jgi:small subunit ribosomal protein S20